MNHGVGYTMKLLQEFGATRQSEIPAEMYAEFMERAQAYVNGKAG